MNTMILAISRNESLTPNEPEATRRHSGDRSIAVGGMAEMDRFLAGVEHKGFRMAFYALRDRDTALDVVQDAMLKLVEKYSARPEGEWPALFFTILNNRITDVRRWRRLRESAGKLISLFHTNPDQEENDLLEVGLGVDLDERKPEQAAYGKQLGRYIDRAVGKLSERQRQVFLLRESQGFNVRDTAAILGCSEGSVKQHHFRAMQALRAELAEVWDHE